MSKLLLEHRHLADAFTTKGTDTLPSRRPSINYKIILKDGQLPKPRKAYAMSQKENEAIKKWIDEQLEKRIIRGSHLEVAALVIVVRKLGGGLRICVDYRALNSLTVKSRYPLPLIKETLARLLGRTRFTKLDITAAFNRIRIAEGYEHLTAFTTRYGQFECLAMPFGLCNAPATFQSFINDVLRKFLDDTVDVYMDDVLISLGGDHDDHVHKVNKVITALRDAGLLINIDKSEFYTSETKYLGLMLSADGIRIDPAKV